MNRNIPDFSAFPKTVRVGASGAGTAFKIRPTHFVVQPSASNSEYQDEELAAEIHDVGDYKQELHGNEPVPVYSSGDSSSLVVPSGLVFVRLSPNLRIEDRAKDFQNAGYHLAKTVSYAPNAGWLRAKSGKVADALTNTAKLGGVAGVEHVEPQMLGKAARKGSAGKPIDE